MGTIEIARQTRKLISIEKRSVQVLVLFLLASLYFQSWPIFLGVLLGGGIALLNFRWLWRIVERVLDEEKRPYGFQAFLKFLTLILVLFLAIRFGNVDPVAFLVGLSTLILGIFFEVFRGSFRN